jgi:putative phage-type endonuclease
MSYTRLEYSSREEWLEGRKKGIGGSDVGSILGVNNWRNNVELWEEKTSNIPKQFITNERMEYGTNAEQYLRGLFALKYKDKYDVIYDNVDGKFVIYQHNEIPYLLASVDGLLVEKESGRRGLLEIKTTEILSSQHKEQWKDKIPDNYYCQCLYYMYILELQFAILYVEKIYTYEDRQYSVLEIYHIERDERVEKNIKYIVEKVSNFWNNYVLTNVRPSLKVNYI